MPKGSTRRQVISWAFYDWANSAFATTVMAGFFPLFFKEFWNAGADPALSTFRLGAANSLASVTVAALAPLLGAVADAGGVKRRFLFAFSLTGAAMTIGFSVVERGEWWIAFVLYVLATIGFSGANIFYDALLLDVAPRDRVDSVSALGFAMGYLGGGLLFALNVFMTIAPTWFGLSSPAEAVRLSFVLVGLWWAVFSIPLFLFVREERAPGTVAAPVIVLAGFRRLAATFHKIRRLRVVALFLLGYWLYIDGVDTIIRMAVDYGLSLGLSSRSLIAALLITQFVGFPAALVFGRAGERFGPKTGILIGLGAYLGVTLWGMRLSSEWEFYVMAGVIGLVQGGVQALSRSLFARMIPHGQAAEFFGFYNLLGKFAAVIGPFLMGWVAVATGSARLSILAISLLFIAGGSILWFVDTEEGRRLAETVEEG